jgi:hypothetical protein
LFLRYRREAQQQDCNENDDASASHIRKSGTSVAVLGHEKAMP